MRKKGVPFKACKNCKRLVPSEASKCPYCGSSNLTKEWSGMAIIFSNDSILIDKLGLTSPGDYAIKVR